MSWNRVLSWFMTVVLILPMLVACKDDGDPLLIQELRAISQDRALTKETRAHAKKLLSLQKAVQRSLRKNPSLRALPDNEEKLSLNEAKSLHTENQKEVVEVLDEQMKALKNLTDNIKELSKLKYTPGISPEVIAESETLALMNLLILKDLSQASARRTLMLMTKFDKSYFDQVEENKEIKEKLLADYNMSLAINSVSSNDLKIVLAQLSEMRAEGILPHTLADSITKLVDRLGGQEKAKRQEVSSLLKESITEKAQDTLAQAIQKYHGQIAGMSFLYNPALPDHPLIHVLVIVSNLSWGLVNTLVGLGFVITAAIVAPITMAAGATIRAFGYEPLFYEMRMPRLSIADSNMQIYADVCGLGIVQGKMSAGLFELDFCTWHSFASDHEAGHAKQSAILGPLYFPAAILSYVLNAGHGGFIEDWADAWATT